MTTLDDEPVARLLRRLHANAERTDASLMQEFQARFGEGGTVEEAAAQLIADEKAGYRQVYAGHADRFLAVAPDYGRFLYAMARACKASRIVEFGSSMGVSTIYLAAALRDNGGGQLIGSELESGKVTRALDNLEKAGLRDLVEMREGDAMETLRDVGGAIDFVLLDGAWSLYLPVLKLIEGQLGPGAVVLGENAFAQDYLEHIRDPANGYVAYTLPLTAGRGNEFAVKVAAHGSWTRQAAR